MKTNSHRFVKWPEQLKDRLDQILLMRYELAHDVLDAFKPIIKLSGNTPFRETYFQLLRKAMYRPYVTPHLRKNERHRCDFGLKTFGLSSNGGRWVFNPLETCQVAHSTSSSTGQSDDDVFSCWSEQFWSMLCSNTVHLCVAWSNTNEYH